MAKNNKSIEEQIEDRAKSQLRDLGIKYYTKTESINSEIDEALKKAPSKTGGKGSNYPDIKILLQTTNNYKDGKLVVELKSVFDFLIKNAKSQTTGDGGCRTRVRCG